MFDIFTISTIIVFSVVTLRGQLLGTTKMYNASFVVFWYFVASIFVIILSLLFFMDITFWLNTSYDLSFNYVNQDVTPLNIVISTFGSANCIYSFLTACALTMIIFFVLLLVRIDSLSSVIYLNLVLLIVVSVLFIFNKSFIIMFLLFEALLLISINILKLTSKSERISEAISEMFV